MEYQELEQEFASFARMKYASAVNTGTAALHLALLAVGVKEGDEVIVPDFTFVACGFSVLYAGAKPIFVDCDSTFNIDTKLIEEKITPRTKAIMAVHVYGRRCNMEAIFKIARRHNLFVIEDLSEAHGIVPTGDIACYSFQSSKVINSQEGGIITTNNKKWLDDINSRKSYCNDGEYFHDRLGFNYRMPNATASLALKSLRAYPRNLKIRRSIERKYIQKFGGSTHEVPWVYDMLVPNQREALKIKGVRAFFKPLSSLPMFNQPVGKMAKYISEHGIVLPIDERCNQIISSF